MLTAIFYMLTAIFYLAIFLAGIYLVLTGNKLFEGKDSDGVIYFVLSVVFIVLSVFAFKLEEQIGLSEQEASISMWPSVTDQLW